MSRCCAECRRGEQTGDADWFVTGHDGDRPFRQYVCADHYTMLCDDGSVAGAKPVSQEAWAGHAGYLFRIYKEQRAANDPEAWETHKRFMVAQDRGGLNG